MFINMSNFAKKQLLKYGWTEGKGLGKNENGIAEALRPKLKFNNEGLGYNSSPGTEWWQTAFDNAAKNIVINKQNDEISFSISNKNSTADKAAKVMLKSKQSRQKQYNNFRRLELLDFSEPITSRKIEDIEKEKEKEASKEIPVLINDELFKACGGRTGHRGSRHGLTMSGKLERIHQQEKRLLHLMKRLSLKNIAKTTTETDGDVVAKLNNNNNNNNANVAITTTDESFSKENGFQIVKSRAAIRREKKNMQNLTRLLNNACNIDDITCGSNITESKKNSSHKHKKGKDKKNKTALINEIVAAPEENHDLTNSDQLLHDKTCKKHRKHNKLFLIKQESTPVGNTYQVMYCPPKLYNFFKYQQINKSQGDSNINRNNTDISPTDFYRSMYTLYDKYKARSISQILKKKKHHHKKVKDVLKWGKYANPSDNDKFYGFLDNLFNNRITEDVSSKLQNLSVKGKKKETNNRDITDI